MTIETKELEDVWLMTFLERVNFIVFNDAFKLKKDDVSRERFLNFIQKRPDSHLKGPLKKRWKNNKDIILAAQESVMNVCVYLSDRLHTSEEKKQFIEKFGLIQYLALKRAVIILKSAAKKIENLIEEETKFFLKVDLNEFLEWFMTSWYTNTNTYNNTKYIEAKEHLGKCLFNGSLWGEAIFIKYVLDKYDSKALISSFKKIFKQNSNFLKEITLLAQNFYAHNRLDRFVWILEEDETISKLSLRLWRSLKKNKGSNYRVKQQLIIA